MIDRSTGRSGRVKFPTAPVGSGHENPDRFHLWPRYVYENIRTSPDVKTTEDAMKRAQLVIRMHEEASLRSSEEVAVVSSRISIDSLQAETASKEVSEKNISQTAINEAVKVIT